MKAKMLNSGFSMLVVLAMALGGPQAAAEGIDVSASGSTAYFSVNVSGLEKFHVRISGPDGKELKKTIENGSRVVWMAASLEPGAHYKFHSYAVAKSRFGGDTEKAAERMGSFVVDSGSLRLNAGQHRR